MQLKQAAVTETMGLNCCEERSRETEKSRGRVIEREREMENGGDCLIKKTSSCTAVNILSQGSTERL